MYILQFELQPQTHTNWPRTDHVSIVLKKIFRIISLFKATCSCFIHLSLCNAAAAVAAIGIALTVAAVIVVAIV